MRFIVLASKACNFHLPSSYSLLPLCYWLPAPNAKCHWLWLPHTLTLTVAFQQLQFLLFQWSLAHARSESLRRANFFVICGLQLLLEIPSSIQISNSRYDIYLHLSPFVGAAVAMQRLPQLLQCGKISD